MKSYHKFNFFKHTYCEFKQIESSFFDNNQVHFKSKSGSHYSYTEEGVYRYSNHWGRVANCRWKIEGVDDFKSQNYYVGYAKWSDFYPLNATDKVYYVMVNYKTQQAKIVRMSAEEEVSQYLMHSDLAHKRLKEIQTLFKEYKWAKYINAPIDEVRKIIIEQLIDSNIALAILKRQVKENFDKNL